MAAGAKFKYDLLWVVAVASLMAIFLQVISARLGVVTGKDLAQCCRDWYPRWTRWPNWLLCEMAIGAWNGRGGIRLSAYAYNSPADYERLALGVRDLMAN